MHAEGSLRIVPKRDDDPSTGRLEIYHEGEWGTICDDGFSNTGATVACRSINTG